MTSIKTKYPPWFNHQTIYEVNLRQYTKSGTMMEFSEHLPRLKDLGVGILWFMPVQPIGKKNRKGTLGSYYSISNYREINPEFGTLEDFKSLVQKIHNLDMKVIIDWVANHTAWDHHWVKEHPEFYSIEENGNFRPPYPDWEDVIHLNYNNPALWDKMIEAMAFWVREADVDGFRCDMAHLVPTLFWNYARFQLEKTKPLYMLAESDNHDLLAYAFDTLYNWHLLHAINDVAAGRITANGLLDLFRAGLEHLPAGATQLNFTTNHDENSWKGSAIERLHYYLEPLTVLVFMLPGIPLIYTGQEAGNYRSLKFFDKDEVEWKEDKMKLLFQKLCKVRKKNIALWNTINQGQFLIITTNYPAKIAAFKRVCDKNEVLVICNLNDEAIIVDLDLDLNEELFYDWFTQDSVTGDEVATVHLKPFGYKVFTKNQTHAD
ncbi:MAG: alpha-amylase family glycosyl hydrolase [Bacteroidales bacterium]